MGTIHRPQRNVWTYIQNDEPPLPKEGETWYRLDIGEAFQYNGTTWEYFHFTAEHPRSSAGYFLGLNGASAPSVDRISFVTAAISNLSVNPVGTPEGGFSSTTTGYSWVAFGADVMRLEFVTESVSMLSAGVVPHQNEPGMTKSPTKGYITSGYASSAGSPSTHTDGFDTATDTRYPIAGTYGLVGRSRNGYNSLSNGYFLGRGHSPTTTEWSMSGRIDKIVFTSETFQELSGVLLIGTPRYACSNSETITHGHAVGGYKPPNTFAAYAYHDKMEFSSETNAQIAASVSMVGYADANPQSNIVCYMGGRWNGGLVNDIHVLTFAADTVALYASAPALVASSGSGSFERIS